MNTNPAQFTGWEQFNSATTSGIIFSPDFLRVLMVENLHLGRWGVPGGKSKPGETLAETVVREFYEEAGILISGIKFSSLKTSQDGYHHSFWTIESYEGELKDCSSWDDESRGYKTGPPKWIDIQDISDSVPVFMAHRCAVEFALKANFSASARLARMHYGYTV